MPTPASALPPVAYQVAVISTELNSTLLLAFLMGLFSPTSHLHRHNLTVFRDLYNGLLWHRVPLWQVCLQLPIAVFCNDLIVIVARRGSQVGVVISTITMLYLLSIVQIALSWQLLQSNFVDSGETRETIFITTFNNLGPWALLVSQGCIAATNIVADGLLVSTTFNIPFKFRHSKLGKIWRCFHMWNRSLLVISLPFFFLVAETGEISFEGTRSPNQAS